MYSSTFHALPVGAVYRCGGSLWRKRSSRTTQLLDFGRGLVERDAWFYESASQHCIALVPDSRY